MDYKIGDEIAYSTSDTRTSACFLRFDKVVATTKTTVTTESGRRFNANGCEMKTAGSQYPRGRVVSVNSAREMIAAENSRKRGARSVANLQSAISGRRHYTDSELDAIQALTERLKGE